MDRELYFVPEHDCYVVRWIANITKQGSIEHWRDLIEQPRFRPELAALHDMRKVEARRDREETVELGETYRRDVEPHVGFGRVAILVAHPETYERAQHLTNMLELAGTLISYSEQDAMEWVGRPADFALPYPPPEVIP